MYGEVFTDATPNTVANYAYADCYRDAKSCSHAHSDSTPNTVANYAYTDCYRDAKSYPHAQANTTASSRPGVELEVKVETTTFEARCRSVLTAPFHLFPSVAVL